jgi:aspartyl-tRNA(Asn)/glutamyl-tRNA(Gln) amidotransferase subunit A
VIGPISAALRAGTSARARIDAALSAIAQRDSGPDGLHAFLSLDADGARTTADAIDSQTAAGPLAGAPLAIKDNLCTLGLPTTCGSRILDGYHSPFEATAVRRLRAAGAIIVGKTNLDEFAMGSSTENSAFGPTRNPHDLARVPGGSSGGSCAAVAAGMAAAALGSETGGSVRQPAAFCGIVGIKPSYGRVSRYGLVAFASSLDHVGVIGRTVEDAARLLQVIAGADPLDATCADRPVPDLIAPCAEDIAGLVVGVPDEYFPPELDRFVAWLCNEALERLRDAGAEVRRVSLPHTSYAIPTYYLLAPAEASSNLARYDGVRFGLRAGHGESTGEVYEATRSAGFGAEVKRRIMLGTFALSAGYHDAYYGRAQRVRRLITQDFERVFADGVDILFTPTTPGPAFAIGERVDDPYAMYLSDVFTVTANLASLPAISIPIGEVEGLPVGGQFLARRWDESTMIRAAAALERALAT